MPSVIGNKLKLSIFGESHGNAIGCVIDGLPPGIELDENKILVQMRRRAPGQDAATTPRKEKDYPNILSGVLDGKTTGAPLAMMIENTDKNSSHYKDMAICPRPSHSDYSAFIKYDGYNDVRGGGHFSGRLTAPLTFAGAVARLVLAEKGVYVGAHIKQIGSVCDEGFDMNCIRRELLERLSSSSFSLIQEEKEPLMRAEIEKYRAQGNSVGGEIECAAIGLPVGIGGNMFDTVEGRLSQILFGIPAVKGVQFGLGFGFCSENGAAVNDAYEIKDGKVGVKTNYNGGVLGGITDSAPVVVSTAIKPTPSIAMPQQTVNMLLKKNDTLEIKGRHDPCIAVRAVPVVEAAVAFGLLDLMM